MDGYAKHIEVIKTPKQRVNPYRRPRSPKKGIYEGHFTGGKEVDDVVA